MTSYSESNSRYWYSNWSEVAVFNAEQSTRASSSGYTAPDIGNLSAARLQQSRTSFDQYQATQGVLMDRSRDFER